MNTFASAVLNDATTTITENGDKTYSTSLDACVDMFFQIAAIRGMGSTRAVDLYEKAKAQNPDLAARLALWARDVRGGAGERQIFRDLLVQMEKTDSARLVRILPLVPVVGRWDDLFVFKTKNIRELVAIMFTQALTEAATAGLAAKWMPSEKSKKNHDWYVYLRDFLQLTPRQYRKLMSKLRNVVEQKMCAKAWEEINYSHVPSVASSRYSKAFKKHDNDRYSEFLQKAQSGEEKINTAALFPYDVTKRNVDEQAANALWKNLPDYVPEGVSFISMIDVSGSMTSQVGTSGITCMDVAVSLGVYLAERNKSAFNNLALSFTSNPHWIKIPKTDSVKSKLKAVYNSPVGYDTNLDKAMDAILDVAKKNKVPQKDMPEFLIVLSDMEFNSCWTDDRYGKTSVVERSKAKFEQAGYKTPNIVWWNIQSRNGSTPVRYDENGMIMVSGASPAVVKNVLSGDLDPQKAMLKTILVDRYNH